MKQNPDHRLLQSNNLPHICPWKTTENLTTSINRYNFPPQILVGIIRIVVNSMIRQCNTTMQHLMGIRVVWLLSKTLWNHHIYRLIKIRIKYICSKWILVYVLKIAPPWARTYLLCLMVMMMYRSACSLKPIGYWIYLCMSFVLGFKIEWFPGKKLNLSLSSYDGREARQTHTATKEKSFVWCWTVPCHAQIRFV